MGDAARRPPTRAASSAPTAQLLGLDGEMLADEYRRQLRARRRAGRAARPPEPLLERRAAGPGRGAPSRGGRWSPDRRSAARRAADRARPARRRRRAATTRPRRPPASRRARGGKGGGGERSRIAAAEPVEARRVEPPATVAGLPGRRRRRGPDRLPGADRRAPRSFERQKGYRLDVRATATSSFEVGGERERLETPTEPAAARPTPDGHPRDRVPPPDCP